MSKHLCLLSASLFAVALATTTGACAFDDTGFEPDNQLQQQLEGRAFLDLAPSSHVGVVATDGSGQAMPYVEPQVVGGRAVMRTTIDGWLLIEDLEIQLADVTIPPGALGPDPVRLTDVELRLGTQLAAQPFYSGDGLAAWGIGEADLLLDWSMVTREGDTYPMATQRIGEADFTVTVTVDDIGNLSAEFATAVAGEVHRLTGLVTLSDLSVAVDAITPPVE